MRLKAPYLLNTAKPQKPDAALSQAIEKKRNYVRLGSGRVIPWHVLLLVLEAAADIWADGYGSDLIARLRLRFVGLRPEELTELVFGDCLATKRENATLRLTMANAAAIADEARAGVWWPDAA